MGNNFSMYPIKYVKSNDSWPGGQGIKIYTELKKLDLIQRCGLT